MAKLKAVVVLNNHSLKDDASRRAFFGKELGYLEKHGFDVDIFEAEDDLDAYLKQLAGVQVVLGAGNPRFDETVFAALPDLRIVQRYGIGLNSIDLEAATRHGRLVYYMPGFCLEELAMHATGLILANLRNIGYYDRGMRRGEWLKGKGPTPRRLSNLTVGLFGLGGSGRLLAKIMRDGFGAKLVGFDPYVKPEAAAEMGVRLLGWDAFLAESDIVSIHAPLTRETRHVFNADAFAKMRKDAMLVNISRGPLVDEAALVAALEKGRIGFAGLDVFEDEPPAADSPLRRMENVVMTPHSAFFGAESLETQRGLAPYLPTRTLHDKLLFMRYLANKDVADKFPDYKRVDAVAEPDV